MSNFDRTTASLDAGVDRASLRGESIRAIGVVLLYLSLAIIFLWIGSMKFTAYEAQGVAPFISNNPLLSWLHALFGIQGASQFLGVVELATGALLLARWFSPRLSVIGAALSVLTYALTLSCLFTTPGVWAQAAGGFPALSAEIGQFLAKDMGLFAISVFILGDSLAAVSHLQENTLFTPVESGRR